MLPSTKFKEFMQQSGFYPDQAQLHSIYLLDNLYEKLVQEVPHRNILVKKILRLKPDRIEGLYFWGGVGRGKTLLMDIFFEVLPIKHKKRFHFHHFMQQIHDQLGNYKNCKDPVKKLANYLAVDTKILCIDEFVVTDIGDAMLIGRLMTSIFEEGVVLVTTSNSPPQELYKDGLQRNNFLPAVELLDKHCVVVNLDGGSDYRLARLKQTRLFQVPHSEKAVQFLENYIFANQVSIEKNDSLLINGRKINFEYCAEGTVWFSFKELCKTNRSRFDYLEIASLFNTVIVTGIEMMNEGSADVARRFISLIDVFYDYKIKLICTADVAVEELYQHQQLSFEFSRTTSRLLEMQSLEYIGQPHFC